MSHAGLHVSQLQLKCNNKKVVNDNSSIDITSVVKAGYTYLFFSFSLSLSPPIFEYCFGPTLKQLVELQFELLSLRLFRVSSWTVNID